MKNTKNILKLMVMLPTLFFLFSCKNPIEDTSQSNSLLIIMKMAGTDTSGTEVDFLQSDVIATTGTVVADTAKVTLKASLMEPAPTYGPSLYNNITLTRYIVSYTRADGKNSEGTDIPYSFEGYLSHTLEIDSTMVISFVIVREVSKLEPPLVNLLEGRDDGVLEVRAKVDFYGHDMSENKVKASGYLTIFFANYAD